MKFPCHILVSLASRRGSIKITQVAERECAILDYKILISLIIRTIMGMAFVFGLEPMGFHITTTGPTAIYVKAASVESKMTARKYLH
jgi:hypothetical protein